MGNLKLLVRPDPGGLSDHRRFLAEEARSWLASEGNLADFVISSEEGVKLPCHLSLLVPHSPLLRAILPTTGYASVYQLCLPVPTRTLRSMLEVLYTGEITATTTEVEQIKTGLTLLGILSPSDCPPPPPPPPQQPRVKQSDTSLAVGVINSSQAKDAASAVSLAVSESQLRPTVELFGRTK